MPTGDWAVRVDSDRRPVGAGMVVSGRRILTFAHMLSPDRSITVRDRSGRDHGPLEFDKGADLDAGILYLPEEGVAPPQASMNVRWRPGQTVHFLGYPPDRVDGVWLDGEVLGAGEADRWVRLGVSARIPVGFLGAGVVTDQNDVVGMLVAADLGGGAWMLPASDLLSFLSSRDEEAPRSRRPTGESADPFTGSSPAKRRSGPPVYPGYFSDAAEGEDLLGRQHDVEAMATLIAAQDTEPPLSIGLFGDWGSGKTFFMEKLREEIALVGELAAAAPDNVPSLMCTHVRQIVFNAWHYTDANLWASLVAQIFAELAEPRGGESRQAAERRWGRERGELVTSLETSRSRLDEARAQLEAAEQEATRLQAALDALERRRLEGRETLTTLAAVASVVRDDQRVRQQVEAVEKDLDLEADVQLEQIRRLGDDGAATVQRISRLWRMLAPSRRNGLRWRLWVAGLVAAVLSVAVPFLIQRYASATVQLLAGVVAFAAPVAVAGRSVLAALGRVLRLAENAADVAAKVEREVARKRTAEETAILAELRGLDTETAAIKQEVLVAVGKTDEAQRALKDAESGRRLTEFIQERSTSQDYSAQLGTIAMIRRDFQRLDELLARNRFEAGRPTSVDRIVLYVDDLDRCPPDRVVEVLQAIHLLLGLRLFVVVVGVDPRWLLGSLELHFERVLGRRGDSADDQAATHWAASPTNYLEKIFQIPFNLAPMTGDGFTRLIDDVSNVTSPRAQWRPAVEREPGAAITPPAEDARRQGRPEETPRPAPGSYLRLIPPSLVLDVRERTFAYRLAPLISTPRAGKRLMNLYRLTRATLPGSDLEGLLSTGAYRPLMFLLAVVVGHPARAPKIFAAVRQAADDESLEDFLGRTAPALESPDDLTMADLKPWVATVARYSFHTGI